jgi:glycosyltransferase involved in cell wall biosynthesis
MSPHIRPDTKAVILEIGDIRTDGRCSNIARSIKRFDVQVTFLGPGEQDCEDELDGMRIEQLRVIRSLGSKIMFIHFWFRAFWRAVILRPSIVVSEDLYSLPAALAVKFFTRSKVLYDAKELYFAIASLHHRPVTQWFWSAVERFCIRFTDSTITSGERDSELIRQRYNIPLPVTINNHPPRRLHPGNKNILRKKFNIADSYTIIIYQGWLLRGRGLFHLLDIADAIDTVYVVIMGSGVLRDEIGLYAQRKNIAERVLFTGEMPYKEMLEYTAGADVGCALIEDYGLSYRHARPNKMFEYIQAHVPVLVSTMPPMQEVIDTWGVGVAVAPDDISAIIREAKRLIDDRGFYRQCVEQCKKAAAVFHWEEEEKKLHALLKSLIKHR